MKMQNRGKYAEPRIVAKVISNLIFIRFDESDKMFKVLSNRRWSIMTEMFEICSSVSFD